MSFQICQLAILTFTASYILSSLVSIIQPYSSSAPYQADWEDGKPTLKERSVRSVSRPLLVTWMWSSVMPSHSTRASAHCSARAQPCQQAGTQQHPLTLSQLIRTSPTAMHVHSTLSITGVDSPTSSRKGISGIKQDSLKKRYTPALLSLTWAFQVAHTKERDWTGTSSEELVSLKDKRYLEGKKGQ